MSVIQFLSVCGMLAGLLGLAFRAGKDRASDDNVINRLRSEFRAMRDLIGHIFERVDRIERHLRIDPAYL